MVVLSEGGEFLFILVRSDLGSKDRDQSHEYYVSCDGTYQGVDSADVAFCDAGTEELAKPYESSHTNTRSMAVLAVVVLRSEAEVTHDVLRKYFGWVGNEPRICEDYGYQEYCHCN